MMLIKTAEPNRQIERMLDKSARRRRLARRQDLVHEASQAVATPSVVTEVIQEMTASNRILRHAKPRAVPTKPGQNLSPGRLSRDTYSVTRWNVFGDMFL